MAELSTRVSHIGWVFGPAYFQSLVPISITPVYFWHQKIPFSCSRISWCDFLLLGCRLPLLHLAKSYFFFKAHINSYPHNFLGLHSTSLTHSAVLLGPPPPSAPSLILGAYQTGKSVHASSERLRGPWRWESGMWLWNKETHRRRRIVVPSMAAALPLAEQHAWAHPAASTWGERTLGRSKDWERSHSSSWWMAGSGSQSQNTYWPGALIWISE